VVRPLLKSIVGERSRSSPSDWQHSATLAFGGDYWICFVSGLVGILAGTNLFFTHGLSPLVIIFPLISVLVGWLVGAVICGIVDLFSGAAIPGDEFLKYANKTPPKDTIIWVTGSDEDILLAKQMLTKTIHRTT
jgi:hypothetical protein